jgi:hypothetical protein
MKGCKFVIFVTLGMSFGLLVSGSLEVSQGVSAIAAVPRADANGVQGLQQRAFIQKRGWIEPHERKPMKSGSTLTTLMAQSMGNVCESDAGHCPLQGPTPMPSGCVCKGKSGQVIPGDKEGNKKAEIADKKAIDTKSKSKTAKDE